MRKLLKKLRWLFYIRYEITTFNNIWFSDDGRVLTEVEAPCSTNRVIKYRQLPDYLDKLAELEVDEVHLLRWIGFFGNRRLDEWVYELKEIEESVT